MAGEPGALLAHPGLKIIDERSAVSLSSSEPRGGGVAVDLPFDVKDQVDAPHGLQRDGRDHGGLAPGSAPRAFGHVGELEEVTPAMAPAQGLGDRRRRPARLVELVVAPVGVSLQHAGPGGEMGLRVLAAPITRVVEDRRRRRRSAEGAVVADVVPYPRHLGLAGSQHRHGRVVAMQPFGRQHMGFQAGVERQGGHADGAHLVGQGGQAQGHALAGVALSLPVQRLVLAELLEGDHRQEARPRPASGGDVEGRGRLSDGLAVAAAEPLTHRGDHLPLARDHLQRLGHVLPELGEPPAAAARAGGRGGDHHPLARQMFREGLARRSAAGEGLDRRGLGGRHLSLQLVEGRRRLQLLQLQLVLVQQAL